MTDRDIIKAVEEATEAIDQRFDYVESVLDTVHTSLDANTVRLKSLYEQIAPVYGTSEQWRHDLNLLMARCAELEERVKALESAR